MQPDHFAAQQGYLSEERGIGGQRHALTGADQVFGKVRSECGAGEQHGNIGKDIGRVDRRAERFGELGQCRGRYISLG